MADCGCGPTSAETAAQRRTLWIALALNAAMFIVEVTAGVLFNSTGLIADGRAAAGAWLDREASRPVTAVGDVAAQIGVHRHRR